ncbi:hypothetical protein [Aureivirga sp. CE67]|nr:hypothetical protein [Aureivirga sp. CE67]
MKFGRMNQRKKPNNKKLVLLLVLLAIIIYLFLNAYGLTKAFFGK